MAEQVQQAERAGDARESRRRAHQEKAAIEQLFGQEERVEYDVRKDTSCILTFAHNVVKNLNDRPFQAILMSATHRHRFHRARAPMIRLMGQFTEEAVLRAVGAECQRMVPKLSWNAFEMFKPILICESEAHEADGAYKTDKIQRILMTFTDEIAAEDDAVRHEFEEANAIERGDAVVDHYQAYQRAVMDAAAALFGDADDEEAATAVAQAAGTAVDTCSTAEEAGAPKPTTEAAQKPQEPLEPQKPQAPQEPQKPQKPQKQRAKKKAKKPKRVTTKGGGGSGQGRLVPGVHTANSAMRDLMPSHKVAAVVIVLDNTGDGLDEHVVFVLGTFPTLTEFRSFEARAYPHMGRYRIMDVPMWQWVNIEKRAKDTTTETIYHTKMQKQLYTQRRAAHELATERATQEVASTGAGTGAGAGAGTPGGMQPISFGTADVHAEDDDGLLAEADAAWEEYTHAGGTSRASAVCTEDVVVMT